LPRRGKRKVVFFRDHGGIISARRCKIWVGPASKKCRAYLRERREKKKKTQTKMEHLKKFKASQTRQREEEPKAKKVTTRGCRSGKN